jgi:N-acetylglutamate synthase-like GNAT family acetyltransferase
MTDNFQIHKRRATAKDLELLYDIFRNTLGPYVAQTWGAWDDEAQRKRFKETTRVEEHRVLELDGQPIGCLWLTESATEVALARIFILPPFQNRGIGTEIMKELTMDADDKQVPVRLKVLRVNPARRLYERLGFETISEDATHYTMLRHPKGTRP